MDDHADQVLGLTALAVMDRLRAGLEAGAARSEVEAGALVHLQAWPGGSLGDLAAVVGLSQPATVRMVDRFVERGLLRREAGRDRRTVALVLTAAGSRAADGVLAARAEALAPLLRQLSGSERETLEILLGRVAAGLVQDRQGAVRACRLCDRHTCASDPGCPLENTALPVDLRWQRSATPRPNR